MEYGSDKNRVNERREKLHKTGMDFIQIRMIRNLLSQMGSVALNLECDIHSVELRVRPKKNYDYQVIATNSQNNFSLDITHTAKELEDEYPIVTDFFQDIQAILQKQADWWDTETEKIEFVCWTHEKKKVRACMKKIGDSLTGDTINLA